MADTDNTTPKYPGVQLIRGKDGEVRAYHRKTKTRLKAPFGSAEFRAEVDALNRAGRPSDNPRHATLAGLFAAYRDSPEFRRLSPRTQKDYEKIFRFLEPGAERKLLYAFRVRDALDIRNAAERKHKLHFANYVVAVLRSTLNWGVLYGLIEHNPLRDLRLKLKPPHDRPKANRRWAPFEADAVLEAATGGIKVAIALGMYLGMREGDALRATRLHYDGQRVTWVQGKTGEPVRLPAAPRLKAILDEALAARAPDNVEHLQLVLNRSGKPYTNDGFRTMLWKLIHGLEVRGEVMPGLTFHGLRHTAATALAELGASPHEIAAMLGHKSLIMATLYSAEANRETLGEAAIIRLNPKSEA